MKILAVLVLWGSIASCGQLNPYKKGGAKCKLNCDSTASNSEKKEARKTAKLETKFEVWEQQILTNELATEDLRDIIQTNAPSLVLSSATVPLNLAKDVQGIDESSENSSDRCFIDNVKNSSFISSNNWRKASFDYGKCIPFEELEKNANAQLKGNDPQRKYEAFERGVEVSIEDSPENSVSNGLAVLLTSFGFLDSKEEKTLNFFSTAVSFSKYFLQSGISKSPSREITTIVSLGNLESAHLKPFTLGKNKEGYSFQGKMNVLYSSKSATELGQNSQQEGSSSSVNSNLKAYKLSYDFDNLILQDTGFDGVLVLRVNSETLWAYAFENSCVGKVFQVMSKDKAAHFSSEPQGSTVGQLQESADFKFVGNVKFCEN